MWILLSRSQHAIPARCSVFGLLLQTENRAAGLAAAPWQKQPERSAEPVACAGAHLLHASGGKPHLHFLQMLKQYTD